MSLLWIFVASVFIISGLIHALGSEPHRRWYWPSIAMGLSAVVLIVMVLVLEH